MRRERACVEWALGHLRVSNTALATLRMRPVPISLRVVDMVCCSQWACEVARVDPRIRTVLFSGVGACSWALTCVAAISACERILWA